MSVLAQNYNSPILTASEKGIGKVIGLCLFLSLFAHAGVAALVPEFKHKAMDAPVKTLQVNLMSVAAPMIEPQNIEPAAGKPKTPDLKIVAMPKAKTVLPKPQPVIKAPIKPSPQIIKNEEPQFSQEAPPVLTSNDMGHEDTTIIPVIKNVAILKQIPPTYPAKARRMEQQGIVLLHALVNDHGQTQDLKIASSSGYSSLDRSAMKAVRGWRFETSSRNGKPIKAWVEVPVRFVLR